MMECIHEARKIIDGVLLCRDHYSGGINRAELSDVFSDLFYAHKENDQLAVRIAMITLDLHQMRIPASSKAFELLGLAWQELRKFPGVEVQTYTEDEKTHFYKVFKDARLDCCTHEGRLRMVLSIAQLLSIGVSRYEVHMDLNLRNDYIDHVYGELLAKKAFRRNVRDRVAGRDCNVTIPSGLFEEMLDFSEL